MAKHRTYSIEFKRRVAQEYLGGETLHGLARIFSAVLSAKDTIASRTCVLSLMARLKCQSAGPKLTPYRRAILTP